MKHALPLILDIAVIALAVLCLVHGLDLPILAQAPPALKAWIHAGWMQPALVGVTALLSLISLVNWDPGHRAPLPVLGMALVGLLLLVLGACGWPSRQWDSGLTVCGALLLAYAHFLNLQRNAGHSH